MRATLVGPLQKQPGSSLVPGLVILLLTASPSIAGAIYGGGQLSKDQGGAAVFFTWRMPGRSGSCSGVLFKDRAVLTAAHCVLSSASKKRRVRSVRIGNPRGRTTRAAVRSVHVHPDYDPKRPALGSDLAILVLRRPVKKHEPVRLARAVDDPKRQGQKVRITGFGITRQRGRLVRSTKLRVARQEYLSPFHCFHGPVKKMAKTRMCSIAPGSGVCPGDSGAPVFLAGAAGPVLIGIVSLAIDQKRCASSATVMIRVSAFADWIAKVTR